MPKGFTLIEIVIATAILMGVTGFGTANYLKFNETQTLTQAGENLKSHLRDAQNRALTGERNCAPTRPLNGWCFSATSTSSYKIYGSCGNIGDVETFNESDFNLPANIRLKVSAGEEKLLFQSLTRGADNSITYCLDSTLPSLSNRIYQITVNTGGEIVDEGLSSGNCP